MRVVVYDDETLEPITILKLRGVGEKDIEDHNRRWRVSVPPEVPARFEVTETMPVLEAMRIVELTFEPLCRRTPRGREQRTWMCFTKQDELVTLLAPDCFLGSVQPSIIFKAKTTGSPTF